MKAFGGIEPLQYISFREFEGLNANTTYEQGNMSLLGGIGLDVNELPFIKTRRNFKNKFNAPKVNSSTNPVTMASYKGSIYTAYDKYVKNQNNVSIFTLSNTELVSFTKFKGNLTTTNLIFSNGTDLKKFDGTTVSNLLTAGYPVTVNGYFITSHQNRLFCTSNKTTTLLFSALNKADDWATANDAGSIEIDEVSDTSITAIYSFNDRLMIFRADAIFELIGTGPSNFRIVQTAKGVGAVNNRSVVAIDGVLYFIHYTGVYAYTSGSNPVLISGNINKYFYLDQFYVTTLFSFQEKSNLGSDNKYLYFNAPQVNGSPYNVTYQYHPKTNRWIGFLEKNVQGMVVSSQEVYFSTVDYYTGDLDLYYIVPQSAGSSPYGTLPNINWYFWTPIITTQTTEGHSMVKSLQLRAKAYGNFSIYLMDQGSDGTQQSFSAQTNFPNDTTLSTITSQGKLLYSYIYPSTTSNLNLRIPIKPLTKNKTASLLFVGVNEFQLNDISIEFIQTPVNTNSNA